MADAVSKLYAEIGFKVNEDGLKQAQKMLTEFAKQMSAVNELLKKQASISGIFAKERAKQDTEREKQATEQKKAETQRIKQSIKEVSHQQQMERMARKEEMQDKRFQQKEQEHLWRMEERSSKSHHTNMAKYAKQGMNGLLRVVRASAKVVAHATQSMFKNVILPNLSGAVNVRDFMMYSGTSLSTLQGIQERFASVGSTMSRDEMMGELASVMDNLTKIRFGKGNLSGLKLSGIQGIIANRDVSKLLSEIERNTGDIDNQALVEVLNEMGFSGQKWLPYFRARQRVNTALPRLDNQGQESLLNAQSSLQTFILGLQRAGEIMTAKLSPAIKAVTDKLLEFLNTTLQNADIQKISQVLERMTDKLIKWLGSIHPEDVEKYIGRFMNALEYLVEGVVGFANKIRSILGWKQIASDMMHGNFKSAGVGLMNKYMDRIGEYAVRQITINHNEQVTNNVDASGAENPDEVAEKTGQATLGALSATQQKLNYANVFTSAASV